jgi:hypothetical protein
MNMSQDPIFAFIESYRAAWQRFDNACTKASVLFENPHATTIAALRIAEAERDAIGNNEKWLAYLALLATHPTTDARRLALLRHMHEFELVDRLEFREARALLDGLGKITA